MRFPKKHSKTTSPQLLSKGIKPIDGLWLVTVNAPKGRSLKGCRSAPHIRPRPLELNITTIRSPRCRITEYLMCKTPSIPFHTLS